MVTECLGVDRPRRGPFRPWPREAARSILARPFPDAPCPKPRDTRDPARVLGATVVEQYWSLKAVEVFADLADEDLAYLEQHSFVRTFEARQTIYSPGDRGAYVLVVVDGRVKLKSLTPDGKEAILEFIEPGELFGERALFDDGPRSEFAEAVVRSQIGAIPREVFNQAMSNCSDLCLRVTKYMGTKHWRIENRVKNLLYRSFRQRLAGLLLELADRYGVASDLPTRTPVGQMPVAINIRLSHQDLASLIGATRETVTILLGRFQLEGLIRMLRRTIHILNPPALQEILLRPEE